jgi:hypothetical protein
MMSMKAVLVCFLFALVCSEASAQVMKAGQWKMTLSGMREAVDPSNQAMQSELAKIEAALAKATGDGKGKTSGEVTGSTPFNVSSTDCLPAALPLERIPIQAAESCRLSTVKTSTGVQVISVCESSQRKAVYDFSATSPTKVSGTFVETSLNGRLVFSKGSIRYDWMSATCSK